MSTSSSTSNQAEVLKCLTALALSQKQLGKSIAATVEALKAYSELHCDSPIQEIVLLQIAADAHGARAKQAGPRTANPEKSASETARSDENHHVQTNEPSISNLNSPVEAGAQQSVNHENQESQEEPREKTKANESQRESPSGGPPSKAEHEEGSQDANVFESLVEGTADRARQDRQDESATTAEHRQEMKSVPSPTFDAKEFWRKALTLAVPGFLCELVNHRMVLTNPDWKWQTPLFFFVRAVKTHPNLRGLEVAEVFEQVDRVVQTWGRAKGKNVCGWQHFFFISKEDASAEFLGSWDKIRYLPGESSLDQALQQAQETPLRLPKEIIGKRSERYPAFVSLAGWLQVVVGDGNILLPVDKLADLLQVEPMTISRYRGWAVQDNFLKEVKAYHFKGKGQRGRATEFRFNVARVPVLHEKSQKGTDTSFLAAATQLN